VLRAFTQGTFVGQVLPGPPNRSAFLGTRQTVERQSQIYSSRFGRN